MTKPCIVPKCKTGFKSLKIKRSVFKVPTHSERLKKWQAAIPSKKLTSSHYVCEEHFEEKYILRKYVKHDANGKVIAEIAYKHPRLHESAVPTIFENNEQTFESIQESDIVNALGNQVATSPIHNSCNVTVANESSILEVEAVTGFIDLPIDIDIDIAAEEVATDLATNIANGPIAAETPVLTTHGTTFNISSVTVTENESSAHLDISGGSSTTLPTPWIVGQLTTQPDQGLVFWYSITTKKQNINTPVIQKYVTLDEQKNLRYYVYGNLVNADATNLVQKLDNVAMLPSILINFQFMRLCCGIGEVNVNFMQAEDAFKNYIDQWHHRECSLLCTRRRCDSCCKLRNKVLQKERRSKNPHYKNRICGLSNPVDEYKLQAIRKKMFRERREKNRAKYRLSTLKELLKAKELEIAAMGDSTLEKRCSELSVPMAQKIAMKEIIAAASKKDPKGRRYTEDWLMLCMLMNIRSPGYYEFLRKNNVMPLPCTRTIRGYFSLINTKCGFDKDFGQLLTKHFDTKTPMQRHGVLLLDEINLRKSIAVCSKNLTYVGLTDFGDDGPQSLDINEQATHGLVIMFQPLADKYTQPIAVFASKNPVKGDELAKLVVKAIAYLEKCGAKIHGVISDGAHTNRKMWSLLDVRGSLHETKTWFTHPLDNERKVFVFSDVPHVFKNIRNRLYNKRRLRINSEEKYIEWRFFEILFDLDTKHVGNARACPRLSKRHIQLDNTSKMRVRLATQIFSNSVAQGLAFYLSQKCEALTDCEETIKFCKRRRNSAVFLRSVWCQKSYP
ncbi:uncharacterized protein [Temnothorax nylanderi]|uniref:uncharacterized protein n=1 Tax=Temnothorax nylanderi TaxID=102681 RepID=UPI003A8375E8